MDTPRSTSGLRPSRRSFPNLQHLSLAPLSSRFPIDGDDDPLSPPSLSPHSSYIQSQTAPATPGILTRSPSSAARKRSSKPYLHEGHVPTRRTNAHNNDPITKAKSTSILPMPGRLYAQAQQGSQKLATARAVHVSLTPSYPRRPAAAQHDDDEWLYRAGLAIASETRESKGQSWLAQRASSTALDALADTALASSFPTYEEQEGGMGGGIVLLSGEATHFADDEYEDSRYGGSRFATSRAASRAVSRVASARNSRRGSMKGARAEVLTAAGLAQGQRTPSVLAGAEAQGYFDAGTVGVEPDFVGLDEEGEEGEGDDEEEVARLARERGFGLGGLVDRLMGWTLFSVDEDREESDREEEEMEASVEDVRRKKREERERIVAPPPVERREREAEADELAVGDEQDGWQDAAWLLSVASKALLGA